MPESPPPETLLLTGATGYIGGRLLPRLESREGVRVRCMTRDPSRFTAEIEPETEVVPGDVLEPGSLNTALENVDTAYYLIHSMGAGGDFAEKDRRAAENFARAAEQAGVSKIIYLGGLGRGDDLSKHLASRQEVGRILRDSGVPTVELRSSIIIGAGSLSFEMIRTLTERLPVMITPSWTRTLTQPISVLDVLDYLEGALDLELEESRLLEIGGPDRVSYHDLFLIYADIRGLTRWLVPVPVLSPWLSSHWLGLVTPLYADIGRELIEGVKNETLVEDESAEELFQVEPRPVREAMETALANEDEELAATRWSEHFSPGERGTAPGFGYRIVDSRERRSECSAETAFKRIEAIGGESGWPYADWLWTVRGWLDRLVDGPGMRRTREHPERLAEGEVLDCWRVERIERPELLRLRAEMNLPGRAWLQFEVTPDGEACHIRQTALFDPVGVTGLAYWYISLPLHHLVFSGMLRRITDSAEVRSEGTAGSG